MPAGPGTASVDCDGRSAGGRDELREAGRKHRPMVTGGGPDHVVCGQSLVDERAHRRGVPERRDPSDGLSGGRAHHVGRRPAGSEPAPMRSASASVWTRCAPLVSTSKGTPSASNTRLLAIAPTWQPSCSAAAAAVGAEQARTRTSSGIPAARIMSRTSRTPGRSKIASDSSSVPAMPRDSRAEQPRSSTHIPARVQGTGPRVRAYAGVWLFPAPIRRSAHAASSAHRLPQ